MSRSPASNSSEDQQQHLVRKTNTYRETAEQQSDGRVNISVETSWSRKKRLRKIAVKTAALTGGLAVLAVVFSMANHDSAPAQSGLRTGDDGQTVPSVTATPSMSIPLSTDSTSQSDRSSNAQSTPSASASSSPTASQSVVTGPMQSSTPTSATPSPTQTPSLSAVFTPGSSELDVTGSGFTPGSEVQLTWDDTWRIAEVQVDSNGDITPDITMLPSLLTSAWHRLTATGGGLNDPISTQVDVPSVIGDVLGALGVS